VIGAARRRRVASHLRPPPADDVAVAAVVLAPDVGAAFVTSFLNVSVAAGYMNSDGVLDVVVIDDAGGLILGNDPGASPLGVGLRIHCGPSLTTQSPWRPGHGEHRTAGPAPKHSGAFVRWVTGGQPQPGRMSKVINSLGRAPPTGTTQTSEGIVSLFLALKMA
jgi:hypothetical protein